MKILVPTDFSACSRRAIESAVILAKKHGATIDLLHVVGDFFPWSEISFDDKQVDVFEAANNKLVQIADGLKTQGVSCVSLIKEGTFISETAKLAERNNYDLIVMGSHGISGKSEWFIGSNTQKVIRKVHSKVLVIKEGIVGSDFSEILYVTDLDAEGAEAFKNFIEFIEPYDVKRIHLLTINTMGYLSEPSDEVKRKALAFGKLAIDYEVKSHFYDDYSVDAGVRHFLSENPIDLVAISNHARHPVKRVFQGSNVEIIVNHSKVPVLSIDY